MVRPTRLVIRLRSIDLEHDLEETDNIETINAYLDSTEEQYREFNRRGLAIVGENADIPETVDVTEEAIGKVAQAPEKGKRGRKSKTAVEAVAPPPIPVPSEAPPAPPVPAPVDTAPNTTPNAGGIPAFLDRTAVAPPPPAPVAPPPVVPASPPVGVLAGKVVAELKRRGEGAADQGAGLVGWLAGAGLVVPGATFAEACDCVMFLSDEKLGPVATALGVA